MTLDRATARARGKDGSAALGLGSTWVACRLSDPGRSTVKRQKSKNKETSDCPCYKKSQQGTVPKSTQSVSNQLDLIQQLEPTTNRR